MFWMRNKENSFPIRSLIWSPGSGIIRGNLFVCLFVFVALRPMSTAMVIAGRSVHLTTLFLGRLEQAVNQ